MTTDPNPFARLRALLADLEPPPGLAPIALSLGETRLPQPPIDAAALADPQVWTRYPPLGGTAALRTALTQWLHRRFGVPPAAIGTRLEVEPSPGSKQAVSVALQLALGPAGAGAVVLPDPGYPAYAQAARVAGAEISVYDVGGPDPGDEQILAAIRAAVERAGPRVAAIVLCQPGSPRGEALTRAGLRALAALAADRQALLIVDECYLDLAQERDVPGLLEVLDDGRPGAGRFLVLHTLSKRSGAPGLRSGFVVGDLDTVAAYARHNRQCGVSTPAAVCAVAAGLWDDDEHVRLARAALLANWRAADAFLGDRPEYRRPAAGMFLWLPVPDDEAAARHLWQHQALTVMPGRYLARPAPGSSSPGAGHLRIALVHPLELTRTALERLQTCLIHCFFTSCGGAIECGRLREETPRPAAPIPSFVESRSPAVRLLTGG